MIASKSMCGEGSEFSIKTSLKHIWVLAYHVDNIPSPDLPDLMTFTFSPHFSQSHKPRDLKKYHIFKG